ncbi:MAG: hypothetical protein HC828_22235 [Blastochloris sp.]|nr:hypothetical protein [Blastochloris sp.]
MRRGSHLITLFLIALVATGCSSLPGLQVLTGQDAEEQANISQAVEALDLVMADKSGATDPSLVAAADRIEAANTSLDIIEIRHNAESRIFEVYALFRPPNSDTSTLEGQIQQLDALRRAVEVMWQGVMRESEGTDQIRLNLVAPGRVTTLDNGPSFIGAVTDVVQVDRGDAASYLAGSRSLQNFYDLVITGTVAFEANTAFVPYEGSPNHPMYMLSMGQQ